MQFRFHLHDGHLYSFWVSDSLSGASGGYLAAGGPGLPWTLGCLTDSGLASLHIESPPAIR